MIYFLLPLLALGTVTPAPYAPYNPNCQYVVDACAADAVCSAMQPAVHTCIEAFWAQMGIQALTGFGFDQTAPTTIYGLDMFNATWWGGIGLHYFFYTTCNFASMSFASGQVNNFRQPELQAIYECDAREAGVTEAQLDIVNTAIETQEICMADPLCVSAHTEVEQEATSNGASFILNPMTNWYDPDPNQSDDGKCEIVFAANLLDNPSLNETAYLFSNTAVGVLFGQDGNALMKHCNKVMEDNIIAEVTKLITKMLAIAVPSTFVVASIIYGGCIWYLTGCDFSSQKSSNPV